MPQIASHVPRIVIGSKGRAREWVGRCVHIINGLWEHAGDGTTIASINVSSCTTNERGNEMGYHVFYVINAEGRVIESVGLNTEAVTRLFMSDTVTVISVNIML